MKENSLSLLLLIIGNGLLVHQYKIKCIEKITYIGTFSWDDQNIDQYNT